MKRTHRRLVIIVVASVVLLITSAWALNLFETKQERLDEALIDAMKRANYPAALALLSDGARATAEERRPAIHDLRSLLERILPIYSVWHPHQTPIKMMIDSGYELENVPLVLALLDHGGDPNARGGFDSDYTLLYRASEHHFPNTVRVLLEHGADPNLAMGHGVPLMVADAASCQLLLEHGARVDAREVPEGQPTPFAYALQVGDTAKAAVLLKHGARVAELDTVVGNETVLDGIAAYGDPKDIRRILNWGGHVDSLDLFGGTALTHAVNTCRVDNVRALLAAHANVSLRNSDGQTALDLAKAALRDHRRTGIHPGSEDAFWRQIIKLLTAADKRRLARPPRV